MIVQWRPAAAGDFATLIETAEAASPAMASDRKAIIESKILLLERFKDFGRKTRRPGVRELALETASVVIVFRVADGVILILRMFAIEAVPADATMP